MVICEEEGEEANDCGSEELTVNPDELLPPIARLEKYADSEIVFNRQVVARSLLDTLRSVVTNRDEVETVFSIVRKLSIDTEPNVRTELMEQLPSIASFCWDQNGYLKEIISNQLVPIIIKYLTDANNQWNIFSQVRKAAQGSLLMMLEQNLVDKGQVENEICPLILQLTESDNTDDHRTEAVALMSKVAPLVGREMTDRLFLHRFSALCQDSSFHVRKVCASSFGEFCTVVGQEATENLLLPKFFSLCEDNVWGVRKSCAEVFMPVSCVCSMDIRRNDLSPFFVNLLCDPSRWVKTSAFQALGPFISTFADPLKTGLCCSEEGIKVLQEDKEEDHKYLKLEQQDDERIGSLCSNVFEEPSTLPQCVFNGTDIGQYDSGNGKALTDTCNMDLAEDICDSNSSLLGTDFSLEEQRAQRYTIQQQQNLLTGLEEQGTQQYFTNIDPKCRISVFVADKATNEQNFSKKEKRSPTEAYNKVQDRFSNAELSSKQEFSSDQCTIQLGVGFTEILPDSNSPHQCPLQQETSLTSNQVCSALQDNSVSSTTQHFDNLRQQNASSMNPIRECDEEVQFIIPQTLCSSREISSNLSEKCKNSSDSFTVTTSGSHIRVHLDNESAFNNFQYWRVPLPELEVDVDIDEGRATSIHVRARVPSIGGGPVFATDMNLKLNNNKDGNWKRQPKNVITEFHNMSLNENSSTKNSAEGLNRSQVQTACFANVFDQSDTQKTVHNFDSSFDQICPTFIHGDLTGIKKKPSLRYYFENRLMFSNPQVSMNMFMGKARLAPQDQDIIPPELLEHYLSMTDSSRAHMIDAEIARHCAYSFPAVALTLGRKYWPCLRETFEVLASDLQWKVRRTLASSIHELAIILGSDLAAQDLLPTFVGFLRDLDEVRIGILQHLSIFLKLLRPSERREFLPQVGDFLKLDNDKNWRFRLALGEQLILMADIYSPADVRKYLVPLALALVKDRVCEVRQLSLKVMAVMLRRISQSQYTNLLKDLLAQLAEQFTLANKWSVRQTFAFLCEQMIHENAMPLEQFAQEVLPYLLDLGWDCVASVRLAVARCLSQTLLNLDYFSVDGNPHQEQLMEALDRLQKDSDRDVRYFAYQSSSLYEEVKDDDEESFSPDYFKIRLRFRPHHRIQRDGEERDNPNQEII